MTTDIKERLRDKAAWMAAVDFVICANLYREAANHIEQLEGQLSAQTAEPAGYIGIAPSGDRCAFLCGEDDAHISHMRGVGYKIVPLFTHPPVIQTPIQCGNSHVSPYAAKTEPDVLAEQFKRAIAGPQSGVSSPKTTGQSNEQNAVIQTEQPSLSDAWDRLRSALDDHYKASYRFGEGTNRPDYDDAKRAERVIIDLFSALLFAQRQDSDKDAERFRWIEENCRTEGGGKGFTIFVPVDHEDIGCGIDIAIANGAPK